MRTALAASAAALLLLTGCAGGDVDQVDNGDQTEQDDPSQDPGQGPGISTPAEPPVPTPAS